MKLAGGRALASDDTEFLKIRLAKPLLGWQPERPEPNRCGLSDKRADDRDHFGEDHSEHSPF